MDENGCPSRSIRSTLYGPYQIILHIGHFWQCRFQNGNFAIHTDLREIVTLEPRKIMFFGPSKMPFGHGKELRR